MIGYGEPRVLALLCHWDTRVSMGMGLIDWPGKPRDPMGAGRRGSVMPLLCLGRGGFLPALEERAERFLLVELSLGGA